MLVDKPHNRRTARGIQPNRRNSVDPTPASYNQFLVQYEGVDEACLFEEDDESHQQADDPDRIMDEDAFYTTYLCSHVSGSTTTAILIEQAAVHALTKEVPCKASPIQPSDQFVLDRYSAETF